MRKHLDMLATSQSWQSPLAVIAHIDLDAFYAQCQATHFGIDKNEPLACRQWNSVIAVNYPARSFGIKRGMSVEECRKLCPSIRLPHVATFRKGESKWVLREEPDAKTHKVSLDPFRAESRKIFRIFKDRFGIVEKAGIDEAFVDVGSDVREIALMRYPELTDLADPTTPLPAPPNSANSWSDVFIDIGAEIVADCRRQVLQDLKYTCSAGIASNKILAKLGSAYQKPNGQTVVLKSHNEEFLDEHLLHDVWGWGGKAGKRVLEKLGIDEADTDQMAKIRNIEIRELEEKLQDQELARSVYNLVRGFHQSAVSSRTNIKSMASVKDFRRLGHLTEKEDLYAWLRVFVADLCGRISDLSSDEGRSFIPRTVCIRSIGPSGDLQSRQQSLHCSPDNLEREISRLGKQLIDQSTVLPCKLLTLEVTQIEELPRERLMFQPAQKKPEIKQTLAEEQSSKPGYEISPARQSKQDMAQISPKSYRDEEELFVQDKWKCPQCQKETTRDTKQEHEDWHFAKALEAKLEGRTSPRKGMAKVQKQTRPAPASSKKAPNQKGILEFFGNPKK